MVWWTGLLFAGKDTRILHGGKEGRGRARDDPGRGSAGLGRVVRGIVCGAAVDWCQEWDGRNGEKRGEAE